MSYCIDQLKIWSLVTYINFIPILKPTGDMSKFGHEGHFMMIYKSFHYLSRLNIVDVGIAPNIVIEYLATKMTYFT